MRKRWDGLMERNRDVPQKKTKGRLSRRARAQCYVFPKPPVSFLYSLDIFNRIGSPPCSLCVNRRRRFKKCTRLCVYYVPVLELCQHHLRLSDIRHRPTVT